MRILHSADIHLDAPFAGRTADEAAFLRRELLAVPGKLADICVSRQCDMVLLAGDLFDGAYSRESYRALYTALERMAVPVFVTPGNHDHCGMERPWEREVWPENVHIFKKEPVPYIHINGKSGFCLGVPLSKEITANGKERYWHPVHY